MVEAERQHRLRGARSPARVDHGGDGLRRARVAHHLPLVLELDGELLADERRSARRRARSREVDLRLQREARSHLVGRRRGRERLRRRAGERHRRQVELHLNEFAELAEVEREVAVRAVERVLRGGVAHVRDLRGEAVGVRLGGRVVVEVAHDSRRRRSTRECGRDGDRVRRDVGHERPLHLTRHRDGDDRALREVGAVARLHVELRRRRARRHRRPIRRVLRPERVTQEEPRRERRERRACDELRR